jgi:hypothetical protein
MRITNTILTGGALLAGFAAISFTTQASGQDAVPGEEAPGAEVLGGGDIMEMDVDFLREKLLKLWIIEEASDRHNQRRIAENSFKGMTPIDPTGDPAVDAENRAAYLKNDKHLRHYLLLELDNCIEAVDIAKHTLGIHLRPPHDDRALKAFLEQELPEIKWSNITLDKAIEDLGRKIGTPVDFGGIGDNEDVRIDLQLDPGFQLQQAIEFIVEIHPIEWSYEGGRLIVRYLGSDELPK